jgi:CRP-like cAMP-binding protein
MNFSSTDLSTILDRILDTAADNLRVAKILVQLGLDPNNITYDALFNRLLEIFLANITLANMFALVGAIFFVATLLTQTMVPLRVANMIGCGDIVCKKDDPADEMFLTVTGNFLVTEIGVELPPGRLMGELGFLSPNNRRTATVECTEDGHVMTITYEKLLEIYFQNPQFGYYFLVLTSQRLLENNARLEAIIAQNKMAQQAAAAAGPG